MKKLTNQISFKPYFIQIAYIYNYYQKIKRATARDFDYVKEDYVMPLVNYVLDLQNKKS